MIDHWMEQLADYPPWMQALVLAISTLGSEDLTTITAGILSADGTIHPMTAVLGCFFGIFVGDGLLYLVGLIIGRPALKLPILRNMISEDQVDKCAAWFEENGIVVVFASRFLPGTRLPTYFAAGVVGSGAPYFLLASGLAVAVWTPLLVGASWLFGSELQNMLATKQEYKWPVMIVSILLMFLFVRVVLRLGNWRLRARIRSRIRRLTHWEFWPLWLVYAPVLLYNLLLAIRYRFRFNLPLVSNPGIQYSGFVGESKNEIMEKMEAHPQFVAQFLQLEAAQSIEDRLAAVQEWMTQRQLSYPLMMKPDVGQRGDGVQKVAEEGELRHYLETCSVSVQAQEFLPGPHEFGISYRRYPWLEKGLIVGLTGKEFPRAVGDGTSTLYELILKNPMAQGRIHIFRKRFSHRLDEVLPRGRVVELVRAGNHCLGTLFNDSSYLVTPELQETVDMISQSIPGFYIGRFDIRADHLEELRRGEKFKIMELNGASAEPSYVYDPRHGLWFVYRTLFQHYRDLWLIGRYNADNGHQPPSVRVLLKQLARYKELAQGQADVR